MTAATPFVALKPLERSAALGIFVLFATVVATVNVSIGDSALLPIFLAFVAYLSVLALPLVLYRQGWGLFHPLIFMVLWWGLVREALPRLGLYGTGLEHHRALQGWTRADLNPLVVEALLLETFGLICMYLGYVFAAGRRLTGLRFELGKPRLLQAKMLFIAALAGIGMYRMVSEAGGVGALLLQRGLSPDEQIFAQIGGHWTFLSGLLRPACLVWLALRPDVWRKPLFITLFGASLFMNFAATGSRSGIIVPVLAALCIWCLHYRRIPYTAMVMTGCFVLGAVGLLGEFREETRGADTLGEVQVESGPAAGIQKGMDIIASRAEDIAGVYGILGKVPHSVDLLYGESYFSVPAAPIPSAIWKDKPEAGGKLNGTRIFNEALTGYPPGNLGEAYWNFHIPGVALVYFFWGMFLRWLAGLYRANAGDRAVLAVFVITLFFLQPNSVAAYKWLQMIFPALAFLVFFCGVRVFWQALRTTSGGAAPIPG